MFKYILLVFLFGLFQLSADVVTSTNTRTVEGTGLGLSRSEAINNAIDHSNK